MHSCMRAASMYVYMYACMHACMHACIYVCMYVCMYVCLPVCMHVFLYVCLPVCVCLHVCLHARMYIHVYMYVSGAGSLVAAAPSKLRLRLHSSRERIKLRLISNAHRSCTRASDPSCEHRFYNHAGTNAVIVFRVMSQVIAEDVCDVNSWPLDCWIWF